MNAISQDDINSFIKDGRDDAYLHTKHFQSENYINGQRSHTVLSPWWTETLQRGMTGMEWNGIWNLGQRPSAGTSKVIQCHHERQEKIQNEGSYSAVTNN